MWVLDDGPFGLLAQVGRARWTLGHLHLGEATADLASLDKSGRRTKLLGQSVDSDLVVTVHSVTSGSEAWNMLFKHLRKRSADATADYGEHEAIALCACELKEFMFVTQDKAAGMLALAELGSGRVATPFDLWADLATRGVIDAATRTDLDNRTVKLDARAPGVPWRLRSST